MSQLSTFRKNTPKTRGIIKEILGMRNQNGQPSISKLITQTDDAITDKGRISNELNVFLTNIGPSLSAKIPAVTKAYVNSNSIHSQTNFIFFYPVTPKEVEKQFESLNTSKTSGPENIPIKHQNCCKIISPMLSDVFNQLIKERVFSSNNYRPISLLSPFSKLP